MQPAAGNHDAIGGRSRSRLARARERVPDMSPSTFVTEPVPGAAPALATTAVVRGHGLVKRFGTGTSAVHALRGVDIGFARGSFTAIMGPSGSGKSTLLHILAGLDRPTDGWVEIDGTRLDALNDRDLTLLRRRSVGFVFQAYNLLPVLTAEENITLPLRIGGERVDRDWLETLIEAVGLGDRRTHRPAEMSGGQQQRVAVARALVTRPAVVFGDEPTGNLDSTSSREILALMRRAVDELGQTIVMVTHDPSAATVADRVAFLTDGRVAGIEEHPTIDDILDHLRVPEP
jgi:putative ABC transport system ATP-binding protein